MFKQKLLKIFVFVFFGILITPCIKSFTQNDQDVRSFREKADSELSKGNFILAQQLYERWVEAMPRDAESFVLLAKCRFKQNDKDGGLSALERAAKLGYTRADLIEADTAFTAYSGIKKYDLTLATIRKNKTDGEKYPFRYVQQVRMGRYRILYPKNYNPDKRYNLAVMLHGNGNDPTIMLKLAEQLNLEDIIVISPEAPYLKFKESASSFTEKYTATGEDRNFPDSLKDDVISLSAQWYDSIIDDASTFLPLKKTLPLLIGFSQGGFYASVIGTRFPHRYSGIATICASMYQEGKVLENLKNLKKYSVPYLILHSNNDPVVPYQTGELLASSMKSENIDYEFFSYPGGHWVNDEAMAKLKNWIINHLPK